MALTLNQARQSVQTNLRVTRAELSDEDIIDLINQAIDFAPSESMLVEVADETLTQTNDQYEYNLTGGELGNLWYILWIQGESETSGLFTHTFPSWQWRIEQASTPFLWFNRASWAPNNAKLMRVVGLKPQDRVTDPDGTINLPASWLVWKASAFGHGVLSGQPNSPTARWHEQRVLIAESYAEQVRLGSKDFRIPSYAQRVRGRYS